MTQDCQAQRCSVEHFFCKSLPCLRLRVLSYSAGAMTSAERLGNRIREWRQKKRLTQDALGEKIGSDGPRVHRLERGKENPTLETLDKLADALGIDVSQLLEPRPEDAGHADRPREGAAVLAQYLVDLDTEFPAEDSVEGDIHKALAALTRALRRERHSRAPEQPPAKARS